MVLAAEWLPNKLEVEISALKPNENISHFQRAHKNVSIGFQSKEKGLYEPAILTFFFLANLENKLVFQLYFYTATYTFYTTVIS